MKRKYLFAVIYSTLLIAFTTYILLDTFVILKKHKNADSDDYYNSLYTNEETTPLTDTNNESKSKSSKSKPLGKGQGKSKKDGKNSSSESTSEIDNSNALDVNTYKDENIAITVTQYRENDTNIYVADVKISSMKYFKTALAEDSYGRNITEKTSEIAKNKNAILAINGDYYGSRESGCVIRNGVLYRGNAANDRQALVIKTDGSFEIIEEEKTPISTLTNDKVAHILSFGPALIEKGKISVTGNDEVGKAKISNPRTTIGIIDNLHYVFVVSDGRTDESKGLSLYQLAEFMNKLGVVTAYNLDGGGSSTMYFNGNVINKPTTNGNSIKERSVSDIVYIGN